MTTYEWAVMILVFFLTSIVGVVTGSNSLIAVPVMFQFGIDPHGDRDEYVRSHLHVSWRNDTVSEGR